MYDLSILIPSRNEEWLGLTLEDLLKNIRGNTEIIVVLDGAPSVTKLPEAKNLTVIELAESVGQRAATNLGCRRSTAKYIMKTDAHTAWDVGFDIKMMAIMQDDYTMVPVMKNLHVFDWVCEEGHRRYQGPSGPCSECGKETNKDIVWNPKQSPQSTSYCFDSTLHFQYFKDYAKRVSGNLTDTMSLQGSCFMLTRDKYWELNISDEAFGSWGQQGVEVACKTWLSGGRVVCNHTTWYAHLFRTQGGDFSFPYPLSSGAVEKARKFSRELFLDNTWPLQKYPLSWLIDKFAPVPGWHDESGKDMLNRIRQWGVRFNRPVKKEIIYYTDSELDETIAKPVREQLALSKLPVISVSLRPMDFGTNIVFNGERGYLTMFKQILAGLEASNADVVYLCEHDVLYDPSHFEFTPPDNSKVYYNKNVWHYRTTDGYAISYDAKRVSQICAYRDLLVEHYRKRVALVEANGFSRKMGFEPGTHNRPERVDDLKSEYYQSTIPSIDIRHQQNLTNSRWHPSEFRDQRNCANWRDVKNGKIEGWKQLPI